jgi:hypothetical protein
MSPFSAKRRSQQAGEFPVDRNDAVLTSQQDEIYTTAYRESNTETHVPHSSDNREPIYESYSKVIDCSS